MYIRTPEQEILKDLETKKTLYSNSGFMLQSDSLTGETINPEFQSIDRGLYQRIEQYKSRNKPRDSPRVEQRIKALKQGHKIVLGVGGC